MLKEKLKKLALKTGLDAIGIVGCAIAAGHAPDFVPALEGFEMVLAVAAGVWLYIPMRGLIGKAVEQINKDK